MHTLEDRVAIKEHGVELRPMVHVLDASTGAERQTTKYDTADPIADAKLRWSYFQDTRPSTPY